MNFRRFKGQVLRGRGEIQIQSKLFLAKDPKRFQLKIQNFGYSVHAEEFAARADAEVKRLAVFAAFDLVRIHAMLFDK